MRLWLFINNPKYYRVEHIPTAFKIIFKLLFWESEKKQGCSKFSDILHAIFQQNFS